MALNDGMTTAFAQIFKAAGEGHAAALRAGEWVWAGELKQVRELARRGLTLRANELAELEVARQAQLQLVPSPDDAA